MTPDEAPVRLKTKAKKSWILPLVLLIITAGVFWVLPSQLPKPKLKVDFETANSKP
jgi:paraquat-inducible protein B